MSESDPRIVNGEYVRGVTTGRKLAKKAKKGHLTMAHPGGIVSEALREMAKNKWLAKQANKNA